MKKQQLEETKALNLIKLRHYKLLKRKKQEDTTTFIVKSSRGKKAVILCLLNRKVVGVVFVRQLKKLMDKIEVDKGVLVANARYTWASKREARRDNIELIPRHFPSFNIFKHKLVPKHEILPPEKTKDLLERYRIKPYLLPRIKTSDPAVVAIGAKCGEIVKITRKSPTAGKYVAYRLVVS